MYRSPELADIEGTAMFGSARLTEAVDIWALGCVLYNMAFFKPPFPPDGLRTSRYSVPANSYSKDLPLLLKRMLAEDVEERATIDEVIACVDAILANEPMPKKGTVQSTNTTASRTSSGRKDASRASSKPSLPVVDVMSAPTPAAAPAFANFADFSAPTPTKAAPAFDAFAAPAPTAPPVAPLAPLNTAFDPFGAPPAPANKVVDNFGFIVSPTNQPEKHTQARDAFSAFEDLNKPTPIPWEQGKVGNPMSPMGLHNMQSPMGYQQPAMNYGHPTSPMGYGQPNATYGQPISPMGYTQPNANYGQPISPMGYVQPNANYGQQPTQGMNQGGQQGGNACDGKSAHAIGVFNLPVYTHSTVNDRSGPFQHLAPPGVQQLHLW
ncbi:hypothetical protein THRCLA_11052 [Thraustotheca clavata]|uniref:non-specific serine/threonine protein kinase n=1 Tax=Thraustotheca clavata TaxID=74557 RepID=A0A1V9Y914_9STRA|nr:hypothetical protein THRCLA_11052 [Thraustotheca clavata]